MKLRPTYCYFLLITMAALTFGCEDPDNSGTDPDEELGVTQELVAFPLPGKIALNWIGVLGAESYTLFWTNDNTEPAESSAKIENIIGDHYSHENLDHSKTYKYRLQALNGEMTGPLSPVSSAKPGAPLLNSPENLTASVSGSTVTLHWDSDNPAGTLYHVKRKCPLTDYSYTIVAENISGLTYTDSDLTTGLGYFYVVNAYNADNETGYSDPAYAATKKQIFEHERNNENISNTLSYDTHYWDAEETTEDLDWFTIEGGYSGTYAIYSSGYYKNFESDCFLLTLENNDKVTFSLIDGEMGGLWAMEITAVEFGQYTSGGDRELYSHTFTQSSPSFVYRKSSTGTVFGSYLRITMWDDLINTGPYNYKIEVKIERQP